MSAAVFCGYVVPGLPRNTWKVSCGVTSQFRKDVRRPVCATSELDSDGVRVNKCFKARFSRRQADMLVDAGRVTINGQRALPGDRVRPGDSVALDGNPFEWERLTLSGRHEEFAYIKMHKPAGIVSTTNLRVENNIISALVQAGYDGGDRVFPVGRLDEQTSGIILCTSDGELVNAALGKQSDCEKVYLVRVDKPISDEDISTLRNGVVIKTVARQAYERRPLVAHTLPCRVERATVDPEDMMIRITLKEGRNRQIRKMLGAIGHTVRALHRESFMGIDLRGCEEPGSWSLLNDDEMSIVRSCIERRRIPAHHSSPF